MKMPRTNIHLDNFNEVHRRLASPGLPVERAGAFFYYTRNSPFSGLIRSAKYRSRPSIARYLGASYAKEIKPDGFFDDIDAVVPMPLHILKFAKRGYNQSEAICKGISDVTSLELRPDLLSVRRHATQTRKSAIQRLKNVEDKFHCAADASIEGAHLLVVDDVITTGATMLAALTALRRSNPLTKVSVLVLGCTH